MKETKTKSSPINTVAEQYNIYLGLQRRSVIGFCFFGSISRIVVAIIFSLFNIPSPPLPSTLDPFQRPTYDTSRALKGVRPLIISPLRIYSRHRRSGQMRGMGRGWSGWKKIGLVTRRAQVTTVCTHSGPRRKLWGRYGHDGRRSGR